MTITVQMTRRGKEIHRVSSGDLLDAVASGARVRASCPIHGGDHQRSLSIDRASGWGFCHCCHAFVEVALDTPGGRQRFAHSRQQRQERSHFFSLPV